MYGLKRIIQKFRFRKLILAVADAFIVVIAALLTNFALSNVGRGVTLHDLQISILVSVI